MPPSQLKKLKASLREKGVVRQQSSKKQQRQAAKNGTLKDSRSRTNAALQSIREEFNPFEAKPASRGKFELSQTWKYGGTNSTLVVARPGVTKGLGEETRRKTLLVESQRRTKVGGVLDRRFGEGDATMTPEEKALHRFVAEKQRASKKNAIFDLEDDNEDGNLTHGGKTLPFDRLSKMETLNDSDSQLSEERVNGSDNYDRPPKRRRLFDPNQPEAENAESGLNESSERPKTKNEVMKEVIAKSKLHKYERQQAKEDDDDLRAELDKDLPDIHALISGGSKPAFKNTVSLSAQDDFGSMNVDRMALFTEKDRSQADREYDLRLRQMALDQRAKPTAATMTSEEKAILEAQRLQDLERRRLQRMEGDLSGSDSGESEDTAVELQMGGNDDRNGREGTALALGSGLGREAVQELGVEDEDEFVIDDNLVDIDELPEPENSDLSGYDSAEGDVSVNGEDAEFVYGSSIAKNADRDGAPVDEAKASSSLEESKSSLAFTFPCPQTHKEFLDITRNVTLDELPLVVQRIRSLYQPQLASVNKEKLGKFATILVDHVSYIANTSEDPPLVICEALIRHIHSLAKTFPEEVGGTFRDHLRSICQSRPTAPTTGDLVVLTAISTTFPTSDHFHQVVTPALLCMAEYLGQKIPSTLKDLATGAYIVSLCLDFQRFSKRYVPEAINYALNTIVTLLPVKPRQSVGLFPHYARSKDLQIEATDGEDTKGELRLDFRSLFHRVHVSSLSEEQRLKQALLATHISLVGTMARLWRDKPAFCELIEPLYTTLQVVVGRECSAIVPESIRSEARDTAESILQLLEEALQARQPLHLHNHRPLAIKTSMPKFEESFDPDKHYDPDRDRAELSKLKAEHKKERKGALRELRKDANFLARQSLKDKKERDSAYEKKFKRLVAEIQGEEGREAKLYEKEKKMRKGRR